MPEFRICTLRSGSSGNVIYAQSSDGAVLIDAGASGKAIAQAITQVGGHVDMVDGLLLSHDHRDHCYGAGVLSRRHGIPLFMTRGTYAACASRLGRIREPRFFQAGATLSIGGFCIHVMATPHDGAEPVAFVLERNGVRCGVLTDLGHCFPELLEVIPTLDAVVLESNYDPEMLRKGPYSPGLKQRILGPNGHISNEQAAALLHEHGDVRLRMVMLAHLSEVNNHPQTALRCMGQVLRKRVEEDSMQILVAPRHEPSRMMVVRRHPHGQGGVKCRS